MTLQKQCRCHLSPVLGPPSYLRPEDMAVFRDGAEMAVPDPLVYSDWFQGADERRRRLAVGTRRYTAVRDKLSREPEYADFIDHESGLLIPVSVLADEDSAEHAQRVGKVRAAFHQRAKDLASVATYGFAV